MNKLQEWAQKQKTRRIKNVNIYDFFFKEKHLSYISYRLRYFFLGALSTLCFHLVTFYILLTQLSPTVFKYFILLTLVLRSVDAFWWGATELLRTDVRSFYFFKQRQNAFNSISSWLGISYCLSGLCVIAIIISLSLLLFYPAFFSKILLIYGILMLTYLAFELPVRTYYFGVYAIQRVMRPAWSILGINIILSTLALVLAIFFNSYAIIVIYFAGSALKLFLTFYYTRQTTRLHNLSIKSCCDFLPKIKKYSKKILKLGLLGIALRFDNLLLFSCAYSISDFSKSSILISLFLIVPMIHAGYDWSYLFYFDLKKLITLQQKILYKHLLHKLFLITPIIGAACAMIGLLLLFIFHQDSYDYTLLLLIPWLAIRSQLGFCQIQAFSEFRYKDVFLSSAILLLPGVFFIDGNLNQEQFLVSVFIATILSLIYCLTIRTQKSKHHEQKISCHNIYLWLNKLTSKTESVTIFKVKLNYPSIYPKDYFYQKSLPKLLGLFEELVFLHSHELLAFKYNITPSELGHALAKENNGDIKSFQSLVVDTKKMDGEAFYLWLFNKPMSLGEYVGIMNLNSAVESHFLAQHLDSSSYSTNKTRSTAEFRIKKDIYRLFETKFPNGQYYNPAPNKKNNTITSGSEIIRAANKWLVNSLSKCMIEKENNISVLYYDSSIQVIFSIPSENNNVEDIRDWIERLNEINFLLAIRHKKSKSS